MSSSPSPHAAVFTPLPGSRSSFDGHATAAAFASQNVAATSQASGYAAGWAQGVAAAAEEERRVIAELRARAAAEVAALQAQVAQAITSLEVAADELRARTAPQLDAVADAVAIAVVDLAEVVIGREIADDGTRGFTALRRALDASPTHADITVRLNPEDLAVVEQMRSTEGLAALAENQVTIVADPRLAPGDAFAEFPGGLVDARTDTALARIRGQLRGAARPAGQASRA